MNSSEGFLHLPSTSATFQDISVRPRRIHQALEFEGLVIELVSLKQINWEEDQRITSIAAGLVSDF